MRRDIEFNAEGLTLRGWLYTPEGAHAPFPAVVMAHGFSAVKEMCLQDFAAVFAEAGLAVIVFDFRNLGASDGEPRQELDPWMQVRDYRHAITYAQSLPEIDASRIGVWGSSFSGGHALVVGAIDRRVKCIVAQVPGLAGVARAERLTADPRTADWRARCDADRKNRFQGGSPAMLNVVSNDPSVGCASASSEAFAWFTGTAHARAPLWRNEVTLRTMEMITEYEPSTYVERIGGTPTLIVLARKEVAFGRQKAMYERLSEPKNLVVLDGGHFDPYQGPLFAAASGAQRDWFVQHLCR